MNGVQKEFIDSGLGVQHRMAKDAAQQVMAQSGKCDPETTASGLALAASPIHAGEGWIGRAGKFRAALAGLENGLCESTGQYHSVPGIRKVIRLWLIAVTVRRNELRLQMVRPGFA